MNLPALNVPAIANAGAGLCVSSIVALGTIISSLEANGRPPLIEIAAAFVGITVGAVMCYVGRPSTIPK